MFARAVAEAAAGVAAGGGGLSLLWRVVGAAARAAAWQHTRSARASIHRAAALTGPRGPSGSLLGRQCGCALRSSPARSGCWRCAPLSSAPARLPAPPQAPLRATPRPRPPAQQAHGAACRLPEPAAAGQGRGGRARARAHVINARDLVAGDLQDQSPHTSDKRATNLAKV